MPAVFGQQSVQVSRFLFYEGELDPPDCGGQPLPPRNAAYCNGEGFVAFDVDWFLKNMKSQAGDSSVHVILFHEWGHAVQDQIGGPSLGSAMSCRQTAMPVPPSRRLCETASCNWRPATPARSSAFSSSQETRLAPRGCIPTPTGAHNNGSRRSP